LAALLAASFLLDTANTALLEAEDELPAALLALLAALLE
jgi:hypothetical protein